MVTDRRDKKAVKMPRKAWTRIATHPANAAARTKHAKSATESRNTIGMLDRPLLTCRIWAHLSAPAVRVLHGEPAHSRSGALTKRGCASRKEASVLPKSRYTLRISRVRTSTVADGAGWL